MKNYLHILLRTLLLILTVTLTLSVSVPVTASAQTTAVFQGNTVFNGNTVIPASQAAPPPIISFQFGIHEHAIGDSAAYPTIPFGMYRVWGTPCQWDTMWTGAGDNYDFTCLGTQLAYAHSFGVPVIFTIGQVPSGLSTINPDNTSTTPAQFPVTINGAIITCSGGNCTATISTLQRLNACVIGCTSGSPDRVTLTGATTVGAGSCPENPNGTFTLTAANNPTDYPWTYTFNIGAGSTSSSACGGNAMFLADNAQTASRCSGTPAGPVQQGGCYAPDDLAVNGTGTDIHFTSFLTQLLAWDAANDPFHTLQYIEMWNEPQGAGFFNGSIAQMARMTRDAYTVIQASSQVTYMKLTSPAPSGGLTSPASYLGLYGADPSDPFQYVCCINSHTYNYPNGAGTPNPMDAITIAANIRAAISPFPSAQNKPFLASEGGWGQGPFAISTTNTGPNMGGVATGNKAGWIPDAYAAHLCAGYQTYIYFAWDQRCHSGLACASTPPPYSIDPAGISYGLTEDWFLGSNVAQTCTKDGSGNWTLKLQRGAWNATMLFNTGLTTVGSYTIPAGVYSDYRDVFGNVNPILPLATTVPIQFDPILVENTSPPFSITSLPTVFPTGTVGTPIATTCLTAVGNTGIITWKEATGIGTSAQITPSGLTFNPATGCLSGTPTTAGTYSPQIRAIDTSSGQVMATYAKNFPFTINAASALIVTNLSPPGCTMGASYGSFLFTATGGTPPYTWTIPNTGSLPTGLTVAGATLSGTCSASGTYNFNVKVTDSLAHTAFGPLVGNYSVTVTATGENQYCAAGDVWTGGATDGPAQLPTHCINTALSNTPQTSLPTPAVVTVAAGDLAGLKTAITNAQCGQTIKITALSSPGVQALYSGAGTGTPSTLIALPNLACPLNNWVYVESDQLGAAGFPPESSQATPCQINIASMPGRPDVYSCTSPSYLMPKIMVTNSAHVFGTQSTCSVGVNCAKAWRFMGLEITSQAGTNNQLALVGLNNNNDHIIWDRDLVHDGNNASGLSTDDSHIGYNFDNSTYLAVINGWVYDEHCISICVDSHAFDMGGVGTAPDEGVFKIYGMHTESAGEVTQMGGGGNGVSSTVPHDIEIRHNFNYKPTQWQQCFGATSGFGICSATKANTTNPIYIGVKFIVKNCYDSKNSLRMLIEGNICDGVWGQQSDEFGAHIVIGAKSQSIKAIGTATSDGAGNMTWVSGTKFNSLGLSSLCGNPGACRFQYNSSLLPYPYAVTAVGPGGCTNNCTTLTVTPAPPVSASPLSFTECLPGQNPTAEVYEGTIRYNIFRNASRIGGITTSLSDCLDAGLGTKDWSVHDNVGDGLDGLHFNLTAGACCTWANGWHVSNANPSNGLQNVSIFHNTVITYLSGGSIGLGPSMGFSDGPLAGVALIPNLLVYDNLGVAGWARGNVGLCSGSTNAAQAGLFSCVASTHCFDNNYMATNTTPLGNLGNAVNNTPYSTTDNNACPHALIGNTTVTNYNSFQFVNLNGGVNGDYHLSLTSPYRGLAYDGTDPGANIDTVNQATSGLLPPANYVLLSSLNGPNTPTCTGNGIPDAGCNAAFTALNTDAANTNAQTQVIGPTPGNMSTLPTRNYLYTGATTKVRAYYQPWFRNDGGGSHINIGMDESNPATIAAQAAAMVAMGVDVINIDYYGTAATHAFLKTVTDAWTTYLTANPSVSLKQEIMLDQGALLPFCTDTLTVWSGVTAYTTGQGVTFSGHSYIALSNNTNKQPDTNPAFWQVMETCILNAMETQLDTIDSAYGSKSTYSKDASGRPFLFLFITPANWANTDFAGTIYPAFLTYAHGHYTGRVYQVMDRFGAFGANFDGEYAWIQPPLYVNASPTSQKCWDDIVGGACNWATGVGGGTSYLNTFYTACRANPTKHCIGMLSKGFDWTHASWMTSPKIVQQGCGNVPQLMAAKVAANGYSVSSQLEGIGWVTDNDYEEQTAMEMGIDNCARPTVSISAPNQLGWLENPTDPTFWSEATIDHWEIWYANTGSSNLIQAFTGIAPSVSTEIISTLVPVGTHDVYLYMVGKPGIMNRLAGPVSYTH